MLKKKEKEKEIGRRADINSDTILIMLTFIGAVFPLYYKMGKLEGKVNSLCKLLNPRRRKNV